MPLFIWDSKSRFDLKGVPLLIAVKGETTHTAWEIVRKSYDARILMASIASNYRLRNILKIEKEDCRTSMMGTPRLIEVYE